MSDPDYNIIHVIFTDPVKYAKRLKKKQRKAAGINDNPNELSASKTFLLICAMIFVINICIGIIVAIAS